MNTSARVAQIQCISGTRRGDDDQPRGREKERRDGMNLPGRPVLRRRGKQYQHELSGLTFETVKLFLNSPSIPDGQERRSGRDEHRAEGRRVLRHVSPEDTQREGKGSDTSPVQTSLGFSFSVGRFKARLFVELLLEEVETWKRRGTEKESRR